MKKKMKNLLTKNLPDKDIKQKMASYYGWCIHGDCRNLLQKVFKDKLKLFNKMSKLERIGKLNSNSKKVFGLDKDKRISIIDLINKDIVILGMEEIVIKGVSKLAIKFCFLDSVGEDPDTEELEKNSKYTITSSKVLQDRLDKDKNHFPGIITIKKNEKKNYLFYDRFEDDDVED